MMVQLERWEMWDKQQQFSQEHQLWHPTKYCKRKLCVCEASPPMFIHGFLNHGHASLVPLGKDLDKNYLETVMRMSSRSQTLATSWLCSEEKIHPVSVDAFLHPWPFATNLLFCCVSTQSLALKDLNHIEGVGNRQIPPVLSASNYGANSAI